MESNRIATSSAVPGNPPTRIGRFEVRCLLGQGAFGKVYRAHDPRLRRDVAVKVAQPGVLDDPRQLQRFLREAQAAASLHHPSIVPVLDVGEEQGQHYIASSFIEGPTLATRLKQGPIPFTESARIIRALAEALHHAHEQGVVHRDVKPANILLDSQGKPHLLDFGLASQREQSQGLTQDGEILGTPAYIAPERASGRTEESRPASDQYSLGGVLFEMLCGRVPFSSLAQTLTSSPPRPRSLNRKIPPALETICLKTLAKRPEERYASCQVLADDLRHFLNHRPIRARRPGLIERFRLWQQREPALAWSALTAGLALLIAGLVPLVAYLLQSAALQQQLAAKGEYERQAANAERKTTEANRQREEAIEQARLAQMAIAQAQDEDQKARDARNQTDAKAKQALQAIAAIKRSEAIRLRYQYVAEFNLAQLRLEETDWARRLEQFQPGLEWSLLRSSWQRAPRLLGSAGLPIQDLVFHPDASGTLLAFAPHAESKGIRMLRWSPNQLTKEPVGAPEDSTVPSPLSGLLWYRQTGSTQTEAHDMRMGKMWNLRNHPTHLTEVAVSPSGEYLATTHNKQGIIKLWKEAGAKEAASLTVVPNIVFSAVLTFAPDSRQLAAGRMYELKVWDVPDGKERLTLLLQPGHSVRKLQFSPDGRLLALATDAQVQLLDLATKKFRFTWDLAHCRAIRFSPTGKHFLVVLEKPVRDGEGTVRLWETATGKELELHPGNGGLVHSAAFSADGGLLALGARDQPLVTLWKTATGKKRQVLEVSAAEVVVAFSPEGSQLAAAGRDGAVHHFRVRESQPALLDSLPGAVACLTIAGSPPQVVGAAGKTVFLFSDQYEAIPLPEHSAPVACLAGSPGVSLLYVGLEDGSIKVWDVKTQKALGQVPTADTSPVRAMTLTPDGRVLAVGHASGSVLLWNAVESREIRRLQAGPGELTALALTPDGAQLLVGGEQFARHWDLAAGKETDLSGDLAPVSALALALGGNRLAVIGPDHKVRLWDLAERKERVVLPAEQQRAGCLLFTPDGKTLVTGGADRTVRLWEVETGQELLAIRGHTGPVTALAFSKEAMLLVSAGDDKTVRLWWGKEPDR